MVNIVLCDKGKNLSQENLLEINASLDFLGEINLVVLTEKGSVLTKSKQTKHNKNISLLVFPAYANEDEMVASGIKSLPNCLPIVLVRGNCNYYSAENIGLLCDKIMQGADIAMFKQTKKGGKLRAWFGKTYKKLCEMFFGFRFFEGNVSLMAFSSLAHKVLKETPVTKMTKINHWVGVNVEYVEKTSLPKNTPRKTPKSLFVNTFVWAGAFVVSLFLMIFFAVMGTLSIVSFWLLFGGLILFIAMFAYKLLLLISFKQIGGVKSKNFIDFERREL